MKHVAQEAGFREIPFLFATALDDLPGQKRWALQKQRKEFGALGGSGFSLGRRGRVQLANPPMLSCLASASAHDLEFAKELFRAYQGAGLAELVESPSYRRTLDLTECSIREQAMAAGARPTMAGLASSLGELYRINEEVREVTDHLHRIMDEVDRRFPEVENLPGRLVRVEGPEALVVVQDGGRRRLESHPASYLEALGIVETDAPFVVQQQRRRPGNRVEIFFPAIDIERTEASREDLEEIYRPPRVSDELLAAFGLLDEPKTPAVQVSTARAAKAD